MMSGPRIPSLLCGTAVFLAAFLLFQVELVIGKYLLPHYGSVSSVWLTCLMLFQLLLLVGYGYAYLLAHFRLQNQCRTHITLCVALAVLLFVRLWRWPTAITPSLDNTFGEPIVGIIFALLNSIGLSFVLLAGSGALAQAWVGRIGPTTNPYRFYALSNAGSLLGLLTYPFLLEPHMPLRQQAHIWTVGVGIFIAISIVFALQILRQTNGNTPESRSEPDQPRGESKNNSGESTHRWILSFLLAAYASLLLSAVTNHICQDIAPVPLLWMLPLTVYLVSFILTFSEGFRVSNHLAGITGIVGTFTAWAAMHWEAQLGILPQILLHTAALFLIGMFCHSTVYNLRPSKTKLPLFYLVIAAGGVAGSFCVVVLAPLCFNWFWEYPVALVLVTAFASLVWQRKTSSLPAKPMRRLAAQLAPALLLGVLLVRDGRRASSGIIESRRNFYGVVRIHRQTKGTPPNIVLVHSLVHGKITHGMQPDRTAYRYRPTTYFTEKSGIGMAILRFRELNPGQPLRMAVAGLGIGTLASYGKEGDYIRFYEINPAVLRYATEGRFFFFLADTRARVATVLGDARLMMQREHAEGVTQKYDIVVLDAFSGDAVPVHLLTREAFALYLDMLAPDGLIAWNGTNRYLDFVPLARTVAREFGLTLAIVESSGDFKISTPATWILLARDPKFFFSEPLLSHVAGSGRSVKAWTDDFSNLLALLKRKDTSPR